MKVNFYAKPFWLLLVAILMIACCMMFGAQGFFTPFTKESAASLIIWQLRLPRVLTGFFAGTALSLSGLIYQALFRNPLADPFTLGVASGAALGATVAISTGLAFSFLGVSSTGICALVGALLVIACLFSMASKIKRQRSESILLTGVVLSFFCSSLILFFQYVSNYAELFKMSRWLMGSLDVVGYESVWALLLVTVVGGGGLWYQSDRLDLLTLGSELAQSRGLSEVSAQVYFTLISSILVAWTVSFCGPIGFVGLIVPHLARLLVGYHHRNLIPLVAVLGGCLVIVCDALARTIIAPFELPVGVLTSLLGGPFFLVLLLRRQAD